MANPAVNTDAPPKSRRSAGYLERYAFPFDKLITRG
jgi:hypothetical protein